MAYTETYQTDPAGALKGQVADTGPATIISRTVETSGGVAFGVPVAQGAEEHGVKADVSAATAIVGITVRSQATAADLADKYPQNDTAAIMRKGVIWVTVTDAGGVAAGDPVWLKKSDGTFSNADVGSSGGLKLAGCVWESAAANGALAKMRVNFDIPAVAGA